MTKLLADLAVQEVLALLNLVGIETLGLGELACLLDPLVGKFLDLVRVVVNEAFDLRLGVVKETHEYALLSSRAERRGLDSKRQAFTAIDGHASEMAGRSL